MKVGNYKFFFLFPSKKEKAKEKEGTKSGDHGRENGEEESQAN